MWCIVLFRWTIECAQRCDRVKQQTQKLYSGGIPFGGRPSCP
jgi:hypothetical protein